MSVTALLSWVFVFGAPAWLVVEELACRRGLPYVTLGDPAEAPLRREAPGQAVSGSLARP
jgi:hypothetical protein